MRPRFVFGGVTFTFNITFIAILNVGGTFSGIRNTNDTNLANIPKILEIDLLSLDITSMRDVAVNTTNEPTRHYAPGGAVFSKVTVDNETIWESCGSYYSHLVIEDSASPQKTLTVLLRSVHGPGGSIVFLNSCNRWNLLYNTFKSQTQNIESPNTVTASTRQLNKQDNHSHNTDGSKGAAKNVTNFMSKIRTQLTKSYRSKSPGDAKSQNGELLDYPNLKVSNSTDDITDTSDGVLINNGSSSEFVQNNGSELATNCNAINESNVPQSCYLVNNTNTVALDLYNPNFCDVDVNNPLYDTGPPFITLNAHDNYVFDEIKDGENTIWRSDTKFTYIIVLYHNDNIILAQFNVFGSNKISTKRYRKKGNSWKIISRNKFEKLKGEIKDITAKDTLNTYNVERNINRKDTKHDKMIIKTAVAPSMWQKARNLATKLLKNNQRAPQIEKNRNDKPDTFLLRKGKHVMHTLSKVLVQDTIDEVITRFGDEFLTFCYIMMIIGCIIGGISLLMFVIYLYKRIVKAFKVPL